MALAIIFSSLLLQGHFYIMFKATLKFLAEIQQHLEVKVQVLQPIMGDLFVSSLQKPVSTGPWSSPRAYLCQHRPTRGEGQVYLKSHKQESAHSTEFSWPLSPASPDHWCYLTFTKAPWSASPLEPQAAGSVPAGQLPRQRLVPDSSLFTFHLWVISHDDQCTMCGCSR